METRCRYQGRELFDESLEIAPYERLATGEPNFLHAETDEDPDQALDLLEGEDLGARQELEILAKNLLRHAIHAAEVATVGDADPQVMERPAERVKRIHLGKV